MFHHVSKFVPSPNLVRAVIQDEDNEAIQYFPVIVFENEKAFIIYEGKLAEAAKVPGFLSLQSLI